MIIFAIYFLYANMIHKGSDTISYRSPLSIIETNRSKFMPVGIVKLKFTTGDMHNIPYAKTKTPK